MGDLVVQQFVSADGFAADGEGQFDLFDRVEGESTEFDRHNLAWLERVGAILLGAETYRMFAGYWPTEQSADEVVRQRINELPKHVFSTTLTAAPWGDHPPATVEPGDAADAVRRLKAEVDGDLVLWGSLSLTHDLLRAEVVDVVRLVVLPVAIGSGRGVFPAGQPTSLRLLGTDVFDGLLVTLHYAVGPRGSP